MGTRWLTVLLVAALAGGGAYYYWQNNTAPKIDVQTVAATRGDVRRVVSTSGTVRALGTVEIGSQLSGNIGELFADFSSEVKKGQVLARIEPSTFATRVREEEAGLAIAKANVALQEATVARAEANLHKAELDLSRADELVRKGVGAQANLDTATAAQQSAVAELAIAKANVENAKATVEQRQAALDSARIDLERTYIRSPIDGVVIERTVETGQTVAASMTAPKLFTIAQDLSQVQIEAQVDEADIGQVASDNAVTFTVDAYPDVTFKGEVEQIRLAPVALNNVVTYTVVIEAENPLGRLLPGMTANVEIVTGEHKDVVVVPSDALRFQPRGPLQAALARDAWSTGAVLASGGDRAGRLLEKLRTELELNEEEMGKIRAALEAEFAAIRSAGPPGTAPMSADVREQVRLRIAKVLRAVLSPDKYKQYEEMARQRPSGPRRVTLWTYQDGAFWPHEVRLGLTDGNLTEIVEGLPEGAPVVVRVSETAP
ncbi:MAG TPA: efflux RND transporter periplasmic adaptor subunit [Methyloceanibacter sp.]|jgi:HlyD family secretion protein|nr:efflux RND transporter periplasmic adaptor subunit [Methyloceanibacter sp.]